MWRILNESNVLLCRMLLQFLTSLFQLFAHFFPIFLAVFLIFYKIATNLRDCSQLITTSQFHGILISNRSFPCRNLIRGLSINLVNPFPFVDHFQLSLCSNLIGHLSTPSPFHVHMVFGRPLSINYKTHYNDVWLLMNR